MRILGIDCGCEATGYGLIESDGRKHRLVEAGAIRTSARMSFPERLRRIAEELARLMDAWRPAVVAVEEVFFAANVKSALKLGHVRGVALLEAARAGLPVSEYSPLEVKSSVVGYGRAEKHQVQGMVQSLLGLREPPESADAADALAIAICHAHRFLADQKMAASVGQKPGGKQKAVGRRQKAVASSKSPVASRRKYRSLVTGYWLLATGYCLLLLATAASACVRVLPGGAGAVGLPRLTFIKEFPHSDPDYYRIDLGEDGQARYFTAPDDTRAAQFRVSPALARRAFELAARLNYFRGASLETRKKVASLGKKTVVYESDGARNEAAFNYSENPDAMALAELFEKISNTRQQLLALERLIRFDKLGLMKQLLSLESALNKHDLAEPALLIPVLEEISKSGTYMHIAQERARIILNKIYDQKSQDQKSGSER